MAESKGGWTRLARNLRSEIDEAIAEVHKETVSLPFELGGNSRIAVKIVVDDRGAENLRIKEVDKE